MKWKAAKPIVIDQDEFEHQRELRAIAAEDRRAANAADAARERAESDARAAAKEAARKAARAMYLGDAASAIQNGYDVQPGPIQLTASTVAGNERVTDWSPKSWLGGHSEGVYLRCGSTVAIEIIAASEPIDETVSSRVRQVADRVLGKTPLVMPATHHKRSLTLIYRAAGSTTVASRSTEYPVEIFGTGRLILASHNDGNQWVHYETVAPFAVPQIEPCVDPNAATAVESSAAPAGSIKWRDLPEITDDMLDRFLADVVSVLPPGLRAVRARHTKRQLEHTPLAAFAKVADALKGVPVDRHTPFSYVESIGVQVWAATDGSEAGLDLWTKWTAPTGNQLSGLHKGFPKFSGEQLARMWLEKKRSADNIGVDSIFHEAQLRGWVPTAAFQSTDLAFYDAAGDDSPVAAWIVPGLIVQSAHVLLIGFPGAGKSFIAGDIGHHVALGRAWMGRAAMRGAVLYIAAEGGNAIKLRMRAFARAHGIEAKSTPFELVPAAINFGSENGDADKVAAAIRRAEAKHCQPVRLVFIDTLAATLGAGDENNGGMLTYVANVRRVIAATGATVVTVHHPSKTGNGLDPRGHSSLIGDADASLVVRETANGARTLLVNKLRDGERGELIDFHIERVDLGLDASGAPVSGGVIRAGSVLRSGERAPRPVADRMPKGQADALLCLGLAIEADGKDAPPDVAETVAASASQGRVVSIVAWRDAALATQASPMKKPDSQRRSFDRHMAALVERGAVVIHGEYAWAA